MTLANEIAFGVLYPEEYINRFKFLGQTKNFENLPTATLSNARQQE